jgi:heme/copper-type cytochrome/quinol oxidase subunit 3
MTKDERDARIATATIVLGGGIGWMVVVYQALNGIFPADFSAPADVTSETFFFPTIIGGAHIMLSTALLAYGLHRLWIELEPDSRSHTRSLVSITALFAIHPYFVPLIGLYVLVLVAYKRLPWRYIAKLAYIYGPPDS